MSRYAELHAHSAFSFLDGASLPEELVTRAGELELDALALTDHNGFPGVVQFASAARTIGLPTVIGTELATEFVETRTGHPDPGGHHVLLLAHGPTGYKKLSATIARAQLASGTKGQPFYTLEHLASALAGDVHILTGCRKSHLHTALAAGLDHARTELDRLVALFGRDNVAVELSDHGGPLDKERNATLYELGSSFGLEIIATGNVHYARPTDRALADVMAATRARKNLMEIDPWLPASSRHLRSAEEMRRIHASYPEAVASASRLGLELAFDLQLVAPKLPPFPVPEGHTEATWLREIVERGARDRYGPPGHTPGAWEMIDHELEIITDLDFPGYFLIVHEIVDFCRQQGIFCQGRGSAANSAVCFALGITAVDAVRHNMLFERFLSPDRSGPPDIDVDIEARRREEVIQHVYSRYGREHAAQVANVITYRPRSAIRDVGRALGHDEGTIDRWASSVERWGSLESDDAIDARVVDVAERMLRLPRHLGIHSGGMVMCEGPVIEVCPVDWATMPGRTVLQWDKDDCADAGLVKFDLLGLGMLTALRLSFTDIASRGATDGEGRPLTLHTVPDEDPAVYDLLCAADTVGVFQVESRAQMSTLPRLRPRTFYDIVVEVALIRPGPIQGQAVSPYIARRRGRQEVTYLHPLLKPALEKTLGVPLFQEQLMQIAVDAAGFSPSQADALRKAMGSKRSMEKMEALRHQLMSGMAAKGIDDETAVKIYDSLKAFADFGFPESHAFSFAYLVYASAWLKVYHPESFYAGLLGAQPMGFYSPQSLVADARRHGVRVARADINYSSVEAHVEQSVADVIGENPNCPPPSPLVRPHPDLVLRIGLGACKGLGDDARRIVAEREKGPYSSVEDLAHRLALSEKSIRVLAEAGALTSVRVSRRDGMWKAGALASRDLHVAGWIQPAIPGTEVGVHAPELPEMSDAEMLVADVLTTGVTTSTYPTALIRPQLEQRGVLRISDILSSPVGTRMRVGGIVTHRQRPHTAHGTLFLSIEDETGLLNIICSPGLWAAQKHVARRSRALIVRGMIERADGVTNFVADGFEELVLAVPSASRDFR